KTLFGGREAHHVAEGFVELGHHVLWRTGRCDQSPPGCDREVVQAAFFDRGYLGQLGGALVGSDGQRFQFAATNIGCRGGEVIEGEVDLARQERQLSGRAAVVGDV